MPHSLDKLIGGIGLALALGGILPLAASAEASDALQWGSDAGYRTAALAVPKSEKVGFNLLPSSETGIEFTNTLTEARGLANVNLMNGSGVALGDYDADGLCDIYLCDLGGRNALYKNLGAWRFKNVTQQAGVSCPGQTSTGAVFADLDGDGDLDLLVTSMGGPNACFLNDGHGHFENVTQRAGLVSNLGASSMALADIDGNGSLDLYVANYGLTSIARSGGALSVSMVSGQPVPRGRYARRIKIIDGMMLEQGEPDALYLNDGNAKFASASWTDGRFLDEDGKPLSEAPWDQGLSVMFRDLNGDRAPDIYVCNDAFTPDRCWINDGHGRFRALPRLACRSMSYFSMSVDFADINRDGYDDFLVMDMLSRQHRLALTQKGNMAPQPRLPGQIDAPVQMRRNTLFLNRGDGTYAEIANYSGLTASEWTWSGTFMDVDLDGWEDVLVGNGFLYNMDDADVLNRIRSMGPLTLAASRRTVLLFPRLSTPNLCFRNQHNLTFREVGKEWGFDALAISNGKALGDLDNDGDLDVVVNCLNGPPLVYRNETSAPRLAVRLRGRRPNTQGIGAKINVSGGPVTQTQEVICGGRYVSGDDPMRVFAAGTSTNLTIAITWRSGAQSVISNCGPNQVYEIQEPEIAAPVAQLAVANPLFAATRPASPSPGTDNAAIGGVPRPAEALFEDVSSRLGHSHTETPFDDFARQALLPSRLSQLGPGVAWADLDLDGRDDLIIGTGKGGKLAVYRNDPEKGFQRLESPASAQMASDDETAILGWSPAAGRVALLVGSASYESPSTNKDSILRYDFLNGNLNPAPGIPKTAASIGPMALADMDGDGTLELFVGGRVVPGRYPEPASSFIYRDKNNRWGVDQASSLPLQNIGLVSSAVWSDLDGDGFPELLLACEWGPIRVFKNRSGVLQDATAEYGLDKFTGWWTGVTTGDLDGDGRLDIVAGNWGLNTPYQATQEHPTRLFFGDWSGVGGVDLLEAYDDRELGVVPRRDFGAAAAALPFLRARFSTFMAFAEATIPKILGEKMRQTRQVQANTLTSMVFFNRAHGFEPVPLPTEAQFAPAFGVNVADFDGDGAEDMFLSQNFFATQPEMARFDGGRSLLLRGDGKGKLAAMPGQVSGLIVYGEQRGAATADYDQDGRVDLAVTQNGSETKLFHNSGARPGLRIRLKGPAGNPTGVGAQIRLESGSEKGPVREIHAGSGYWSQDSAVAIMSMPSTPARIWVRWPGGRTSTSRLPAGAKEITVNISGQVTVGPRGGI